MFWNSKHCPLWVQWTCLSVGFKKRYFDRLNCAQQIRGRFRLNKPQLLTRGICTMGNSKTIEDIKGLHQYYRDCLIQSFEFPNPGQIPFEIIQWASESNNTNISGLAELLQGQPNSGLPAQHDLALRLMLFTILQANLAANANNRFIDYTLPPGFANNIGNALVRIHSLHSHDAYLMDSVQILYRINMLDAVLTISETHPELFKKYANLQAILGFIHTMLGDHEKALQYLTPLVAHQTNRNLPLVGLSFMTCQYFLGQTPEWPLTFESLKSDISTLPSQISKLPPMKIIQPLPESLSCPIIFAACNDAYFFQHAVYLAHSIHDSNPGKIALHLHLYSPNKSVLTEIDLLRKRLPNLPIGVSVEYCDTAICNTGVYYATARFVRAYELLRHYKKELCIMDVDALINSTWDKFTAHLDAQTELVLARPKTAPFWEQVIAGFLYCKATPKAEHYLAKVAQFILENMEQQKAIWFTDQIALSACNEEFMKNEPSVKHIDSELLMDIHHSPHAFSWAVTTIKNGNPRYDAAREKLGQKYNQLPHASVDYIFKHINLTKGPIFFLQIGAMDGVSFDPIHQYVKSFGWNGILVEPLPDMMQKVRDNYAHQSGLIFENVAITEQEETKNLYRISSDTAKEAGLPNWVLGMSTFVPGKLDMFKPHVIEQAVSCIPLKSLLAKHQPQSIDVLQIDTEGYDYTILRQFDFERYQPYVINFEAVNLSSAEKNDAMELLSQKNYAFYHNDMDIFAVRRDILNTAVSA